MARRDEAWLRNYEDVEFDLPGGSPTERHPMLPPKTHLRDASTGGGEMGALPHIAGVRSSASLGISLS